MSDSCSGSTEFSGWRAILWPVHRYELKKLIPMLLIFFLVTFNYNILRTMKDTLVVMGKSSGAEVIPFIKVWVMFPGSVLMTFLFTGLSNRYSREKVFYLMMALFLGFFFIFTFFLYPNREWLHPHGAADTLQASIPLGFKGMIAMCRNWTFTSFYVMSELWGNIILFVLLWGFVNQVTKLEESKRFYAIFGIGVNISGIVAGQASVFISRYFVWEQSLVMLVSIVLLFGVAAMAIFRWMEVAVLTNSRYYDQKDAGDDEKVKGKLSLSDSLSYLMKSKYLISIALIVVGYNIVINLVEVLWKDQLKEMYHGDSSGYYIYMNQVSTIIGVVATLTSLFVSGTLVRKCGWTFTALLTPIIIAITSVGFFGLYFTQNMMPAAILGMTPLALIVFFGSAQNVLSRAAKYTVFDATKEMAFVPLSAECKLKGKAAIDGVCNRLGKSGGSMIHQSLLILFSSFAASAPFVAAILFLIIAFWMGAIRVLGVEFRKLTTPKEEPNLKYTQFDQYNEQLLEERAV